MSKKIAITVFLCLTCPFLTVSGQNKVKEEAGISRCCTEQELMEDVSFLASDLLEGRGTGSRGGVLTSFFLMERFRKMGLRPFDGNYSMSFESGDGAGHSVIGLLEGISGSPSSRYIIIGAHYDNLGILGGKIFPGADSNGSGVAALLAIAKMAVSQKKSGKMYGGNIIFVAFDGFYNGRNGAKALWDAISSGRMKDPVSGRIITPANVKLMVDLDQLGTVLEPVTPERKDFLMVLGNDSLPEIKRGLLSLCNKVYGYELDLQFSYYNSPRFTELFYRLGDRRFFIDNGIPTLFFTSGITEFNNSVRDLPEILEYTTFRRRCLFILRFIENFL